MVPGKFTVSGGVKLLALICSLLDVGDDATKVCVETSARSFVDGDGITSPGESTKISISSGSIV